MIIFNVDGDWRVYSDTLEFQRSATELEVELLNAKIKEEEQAQKWRAAFHELSFEYAQLTGLQRFTN